MAAAAEDAIEHQPAFRADAGLSHAAFVMNQVDAGATGPACRIKIADRFMFPAKGWLSESAVVVSGFVAMRAGEQVDHCENGKAGTGTVVMAGVRHPARRRMASSRAVFMMGWV